jgi:AcrR family transcriptional regulator
MTEVRELRADARQNLDRLLEAAAAAFARDGAEASLKMIAAEAGVGIGTLYRRFPTRDDLVEATYRDQTARLCASAAELLRVRAPLEALRAWMDGFVDYMQTKHGMSDALPAILASHEGLRGGSRVMLRAAVATLLDACTNAGLTREIDPGDVLMALGGVTLIAAHEGQRALASRLLDLLVAGLRPGVGTTDGGAAE